MNRYPIASILCVAMIGGCASMNVISEPAIDTVYEPKFLAEPEGFDAIHIGELTFTKRKQVSRLMEVFRNAKWAPYIATMPAELKTIRFMSDGTETHKLLYAGGWLFDTTGDGVVRFGTVHADDGAWVDENIDAPLGWQRDAL